MEPAPMSRRWRLPLWGDVVVAFVVSRAIIAFLGVLTVSTFFDQKAQPDQTPLTLSGWAALNFSNVWRKWDVLWYERIALHGYAYRTADVSGQAVAGFFPLYPLIVGRLVRLFPGVSFFTLGSILSNLCALTAFMLIAYALSEGADHARRVLLVMVTSAGSFYLSIPYTEGLFLLLVVATMILSRRRQFILASLVAGLAAITRVQGLGLILVPIVACYVDDTRSRRARYGTIALMAAIFAIPLGTYMAYLANVQGSADAFITRQALWDNAFPYPLKALAGLVVFPRRLSGLLNGAFWFLYVGLLVRYWRQLPAGEALFCAAALLISTQQETFHGIYRYVVPLVPLMLAIGRDRINLRFTIIAINLVVATIMILSFVANNRLAV